MISATYQQVLPRPSSQTHQSTQVPGILLSRDRSFMGLNIYLFLVLHVAVIAVLTVLCR
jgi:hypothetical protein